MSHNEVSLPGDWAATAAPDNISDRLQREAELLLGGTAQGVKDATINAVQHPGDTAAKIAVSAMLGAGLALSQGRAGFLRETAQMAGVALTAAFSVDALNRIGTVGHSMADTWRSDKNFAHNKEVVASTLGSFIFDSALMSTSGIAGIKLARTPAVYMGAHHTLDTLRGSPMAAQHQALQAEMLAYHPGTAYHQDRVGELSLLVAKDMHLPPASVETAYVAGTYHDTGKMRTPLEILDFPGKLNAEQRVIMDRHATETGIILRERVQYPERLADVPTVAERHHERLDGQGTPNHLPASELPVETRINTVADVFDVLSHQRSYKQPTPIGEILDVFQSGRGTSFDPVVVDSFMNQRADKVLGLMLSDGGIKPNVEVLSPFKKMTIGELLQAAAARVGAGLGNVSPTAVERFNNYYGAASNRHRLTEAHI
ncbi:MAG: HD domain-containing protein [Cyanobacteria bacterium SZAS LIN-3]|nr:HD domain-containing protein [Cyanobacteria bacterium SZAS LIN-3]